MVPIRYKCHMPSLVNSALMRLPKRAESSDASTLVGTFVDVGSLFSLLSTPNHQVLYGRRGTGKTHALLYLVETLRKKSEAAVFIDMRVIGSTGGIYNDPNAPLSERATRLLMDALNAVKDSLSELCLNNPILATADIHPRLDDLATAITQVRVVGPVELERTLKVGHAATGSSVLEGSLGLDTLALKASATAQQTVDAQSGDRMLVKGELFHRVHFGAVGKALSNCIEELAKKKLWVVMDEWSAVPMGLQPYLADLIRHAMLPIRGLTVKVGAIEHRSRFRIATTPPEYIGFELGADIAADLDLDDFMVFNNNSERAQSFFQDLLFKHVRAVLESDGKLAEAPDSSEKLINLAFTQEPTFVEFVRAVEGVPRDAVNIISLAAQRAVDDQISISHVRAAAHKWYQQDKLAALSANQDATDLLHWIHDVVIKERHAKAFLLEQPIDFTDSLIGGLYDARLLHVVKRGIAAQDRPGARFAVLSLDYGCYVDLITTAKAPQGLFQADVALGMEAEYVDVPADDYRSIRRAILDLKAFGQAQAQKLLD